MNDELRLCPSNQGIQGPCIVKVYVMFILQIETGLQMLMEQLRAGLVKMKQDNSFRDMDTLVRNLTQNQKSVLVDVQNLQNMNWTSATAKVGIWGVSPNYCKSVLSPGRSNYRGTFRHF